MKSPAVLNTSTQRFECPACGASKPAPAMPCLIQVMSRECRDFAKAHRYCVAPGELPRVALSLRQPWAWLIVNGFKDIENRPLKWNFRGRILVHASKGMTEAEYLEAFVVAQRNGVMLPPADDLERGGIVGEMTITDRVTSSASPWFFGPYGYVVTDAKPLPFQPCKGALGFFTPNLSPV